MEKFKDFEAKKYEASPRHLPAGGYVARIIDVEEAKYDWGSQLLIYFDIVVGEFKGFFNNRFERDKDFIEDPKWKGVYRLRVPDESNEYFENQKKTFGNAIWAVEESNQGYRWNWDENQLIGKLVGVLFGRKEWAMNGRSGWFTQCSTFTDVESIKNNKFKVPKDIPLPAEKSNKVDDFVEGEWIGNDEDDGPF